MAGKYLLCLVLLCVVADYSQCKRFSSGGSRSSGSSWGRGWSSSSASKPSSSSSWFSSGSSKPSSSSSSWFSSGSSKPSSSSSSWSSWSGSSAPKYPSSSTGLSGGGSNSGSSWSFGSNWPSLSGFGSGSKYPASTGLSGSGSGSKYPASTGLSGSGSGSKYPASTGLSGSGSGSKYPASTGLSGSGSGSKYPASTGLSGSGSGSKYPSSTGLSGSGSGSIYPSSIGLSGSGSGSKYPASTGLSGSGSGSKYPASTGLSGSDKQKHNYYPTSSNTYGNTHHTSNTYNTNTGYGSGHKNYGTHNYGNAPHVPSHGFINTPTYYTAPQHVYITEYRHSGSRYGDLLTGLALYNMGRSHGYHNHHYYNDDYYRRRYYNSPGSSAYETPKDEATCRLKIKENNKVEVLKIPCEIVSTFTEGSKKVAPDTFTQTVCVSNYTVINNTIPYSATSTVSPVHINATNNNSSKIHAEIVSKPENISTLANVTALNDNMTSIILSVNIPVPINDTTANPEIGLNPKNTSLGINVTDSTNTLLNNTSLLNTTVAPTIESSIVTNNSMSSSIVSVNGSTTASPIESKTSNITTNVTSTAVKPINVTTSTPYTITTSNVTVLNSTNCTVTTDPLAVKGPPVNPSNMECEVDIITKVSHILRSKVDCAILLQYAKMPEPKKDNSGILPARTKLKSWLTNMPWWMSLFIAV